MRINLIDIDGTLCKSIFNNDRLKNDNNNCLTAEFLKDLAEVVPYEWWCPPSEVCTYADTGLPVRESDMWAGEVCILVTGRLPQHEELTRKWFYSHCIGYMDSPLEISYISVPWDDTKATREQSYNDYVTRKFETLKWLALEWHAVLNQSRIGLECTAPNTYKYTNEIHVYEDDENVLRLLATGVRVPNFMLHVVNKAGEVHDYP